MTEGKWDKLLKHRYERGWGPSYPGNGWYDIVERLIKDLDATGVEWSLCQVKEKFGGLRFYVDTKGGTEKGLKVFYDMIDKAEAESFQTCEACGRPGELRGTGWMKTLCSECDRK